MTEVVVMWDWILLAVIVVGVVTLLIVAAVRQRRYAGDMTIDETKEDKGGPGGFIG
ncbi:MAG: hypothetical protein ACRDPQ_16865 [Nocardioidaceae bacterium]